MVSVEENWHTSGDSDFANLSLKLWNRSIMAKSEIRLTNYVCWCSQSKTRTYDIIQPKPDHLLLWWHGHCKTLVSQAAFYGYAHLFHSGLA